MKKITRNFEEGNRSDLRIINCVSSFKFSKILNNHVRRQTLILGGITQDLELTYFSVYIII